MMLLCLMKGDERIMENTMTLKYTRHHGQLIWSGKSSSGNFVGIMANTPEELLGFARKHFPGCEIKVEELEEA